MPSGRMLSQRGAAAACLLGFTLLSGAAAKSHGSSAASIFLFAPSTKVEAAASSSAGPSSQSVNPSDANAIVSAYLDIHEHEYLREGLEIPEQAVFQPAEQSLDGDLQLQLDHPLLILAEKLGSDGSVTDYLSPSTLESHNAVQLNVVRPPSLHQWKLLLATYAERLGERKGETPRPAQGGYEDVVKRLLVPGSLDGATAFGGLVGQDPVFAPLFDSLAALAAYDAGSTLPATGYLHLTGLKEIVHKYGKDSAEALKAKEMLRITLDAVVSSRAGKQRIALFLIPAEHPFKQNKWILPGQKSTKNHKSRRSIGVNQLSAFSTQPWLATRQQGSNSTMPLVPTTGLCYDSAETCGNSTNSCSGHGSCVAAMKVGMSGSDAQSSNCWVCQCQITWDGEDGKGRQRYWSGSACEKEDVSSQFFLLAGSTFLLVFVAVAAVALLANVGTEALPSTLAALGGGPGGHHKRD